jgi:hypothetical protein
MAIDTKKEFIKSVRQRKYLNKDFDSLRSDLLEYARTFYPSRISDFSDASLGGLLLDMAAYVGDVMSFYLDRQFTELDPEFAVETSNIERLLINNGVEITGASSAVVDESFYIEVPAISSNGVYVPDSSSIPVILANTVIESDNGIQFTLQEDIDFNETLNDKLIAETVIGSTTTDLPPIPLTFIMNRKGICISGKSTQESFTIGNQFVPFRQITLSNVNITSIDSVYDSLGNTYYEVSSLSQDVVYKMVTNINQDSQQVSENLEILPAPYRFTKSVDLNSRTTTLTFGGGSADTLEDDVIPDPSEFAIPLFGKTTFPRISINPQMLLNTKTLGIATTNTTITVNYRYDGGLNHNAEPQSIKTIRSLLMSFPNNPAPAIAANVRSSTEVINYSRASGGDDAPSIDDLKAQIPNARNSQSRIVSKQDLLSRVYLMPANFGRVFRAGIRSNPNNPLASQLFIISRDANGNLIVSPDSLKDNLRIYLNEFRMISDAIDILDAPIINLKLSFEITADQQMNKQLILQNIIKKLQVLFDIKNFQIDQSIVISDVVNTIFNNVGVISVNSYKFENNVGTVSGREYSDVYFNINTHTVRGLIVPPPGAIFEFRYPDFDIIGRAV